MTSMFHVILIIPLGNRPHRQVVKTARIARGSNRYQEIANTKTGNPLQPSTLPGRHEQAALTVYKLKEFVL